MAISYTDTDLEIELYDITNGIEFPSIGTDGGGDTICSLYQIQIYPTYILIAPDKQIVEQHIYPTNGATLISLLEGYGIQMDACPNNTADIVQFYIPEQINPAIFTDSTILIDVYTSTQLNSLTPSFILSYGAKAEINGVAQQSSSSIVDFSFGPVIYSIIAEDNITIKDWIVSVDNGLSIIQNEYETYEVFPNPTNDHLFITGKDIEKVEILSQTGILIKEIIKPDKEISLKEIPAGIYLLKVFSDNKVQIHKIVIHF